MGRKRYVTSDIRDDGNLSDVAGTNPIAGLMWPWFITATDDWGRMTGDPREVCNKVFSSFHKHYAKEDVEPVIALYVKHGLIHLYEVDDKPYLQFNPKSFYKYQSYIEKRKQRHDSSKLPPPRDHPWGAYWPTSDWDDNQHSTATSSTD